MSIHTIIGAGGTIANELAVELVKNKERVRLVSRNPTAIGNAELVAADATDLQQTLKAAQLSSVIYACIGLKYDYSVWREQWPKIMNNLIEATRQTGAKLVFFDNVYMYGKVNGAMTEETPYDPVSRKGDLRARIATQLMSEVRKGNITASIARAADFYGPGAGKTSIPNSLVFENLVKNKKAQWMSSLSHPHSFTYTPDAAKALYLLAKNEDSWNQVWHLPTADNPLTGAAFIEEAAKALNARPGSTVLSGWMIRLAGIFNTTIRELHEMLYQYNSDYVFDSSKFNKAFDYTPVGYRQGIAATAASYGKQ